MGVGREGAIATRVEATHRTSPVTKKSPSPNVNSAQVEKRELKYFMGCLSSGAGIEVASADAHRVLLTTQKRGIDGL